MKEKIIKHLKLIFNAVGLAMGIAVIVLIVLDKINQKDALYMLGIGLLSISASAILKRDVNMKTVKNKKVYNKKNKN